MFRGRGTGIVGKLFGHLIYTPGIEAPPLCKQEAGPKGSPEMLLNTPGAKSSAR